MGSTTSVFAVQIRSLVQQLVEFLVGRDYKGAASMTGGQRLTAEDLSEAIADYGRTLVYPPEEAYVRALGDMIEVSSAQVPTFAVVIDLWTAEEGRSDLSLELTVTVSSGTAKVEIDNLHVM